MSERDQVARGEGAEGGLSRARVGPPSLSSLDARDESGLDVPLQVRSLKQLSLSERVRYRKALGALASGGGVRALMRVGNLPLAGLGVYEALLTQSWRVRFQGSEEMIQLAGVAVEVAQRFAPEAHGVKQVADLQARAWGELGNAYRVGERLRSGDFAFGQAHALFVQGTGDPYLKARLFELYGSHLGCWREFSMAEARFALVSNLYRELGETHMAGRALISRALYTYYSCRPEVAIRLNKQAVELIDRRRDPALFLMAMHNDLLFLVELRRYEEAKFQLFKSRRYFIYEDRANSLRLRWIEGRIEYGLENLVSAEIAFREVKEGLTEEGMSFHAALASLELAMVLLSQDRLDEAEKEVLAVRDILAAVEVYREFLGSVIFLEELFRRRTVTLALIESTVAQIRRKELQVRPQHFR